MLTITHTHEAGTIIEGTSKGDGSAAALKGQRWRWSGQLGAWYIPHSRDKIADSYRIDKTCEALQAAGFTVEVDIDDTRRCIVRSRPTSPTAQTNAPATSPRAPTSCMSKQVNTLRELISTQPASPAVSRS